MQQMMQSTADNKSANAPSPLQATDVALATHTIEPELYLATPRRITRSKPIISSGSLVALVIMVVLPLLFLGMFMPQMGVVFLSVVMLISVVIVCCNAETDIRGEKKRLLKNGVVKPAVIHKVESIKDYHSYRIAFDYEALDGTLTRNTMTLTKEQISRHDLYAGKSFTLLINPDRPTERMPYFEIDTYDIVGASRTHSASNLAPVPALQAAEPGVETELFCGTPRRVVWTPGARAARIWLWNLVAGAAVVALYISQNGFPEALAAVVPLLVIVALVLVIVLFVLAANEIEARKSHFFLKNGLAVQAVVSQCGPSAQGGMLIVSYVYPRLDGKKEERQFTILPSAAEKLGGLKRGTTLTVLRHPTDSAKVLPYYQVVGVEIMGGGRAQFLPPIKRTP